MTKTAKELKWNVEIAVKQVKSIESEIADYSSQLRELVKPEMSDLDDCTFGHIVALGALISNKKFELHESQYRMYTLMDTKIYTLRGERYLYEPLPENDDVLKLKGWDGMNAIVPKTLTRIGQDVSGRHVYQAEQGSLYVATKPYVIEWTVSIGIQDIHPISVKE